MPRAEGTFTIDSWEPDVYDEREGAALARVHITKTFHGDLAGSSTTDIITAAATGEKTMAYVGVERFIGTAHGHPGSFVLVHHARAGADGQFLTWEILPDSGTGELAGIRGTGQIYPERDHAFHIEYELS